MKKLINPASLLLYFLACSVFLFIGMSFAGIIGAGDNQGLIAGAVIIGYGVVAAVIAVIAAMITAFYAPNRTIVRLNQVFAVILILFLLFFTYRYQSVKHDNMRRENTPEMPTKPTPKNKAAQIRMLCFDLVKKVN